MKNTESSQMKRKESLKVQKIEARRGVSILRFSPTFHLRDDGWLQLLDPRHVAPFKLSRE